VFTTEGNRMPRPQKPVSLRRRPRSFAIALAVAGLALAAIAGIALAKSFTLKVAKNVHVTNTPTKAFRVRAVDVREAVAVGPAGYPVYTFQGETTHHLICKKTGNASTNCWAFWPPVSPKSAKGLGAQSGIKGKLGTFRNHGMLQLTLGGKPLYYFTPDIKSHNKRMATGDELKTFGSIWHIVTAGGSGKAKNSPPPSMNPPLPPGY
jgi:predicted lipoprotein with Yx(FWY)xxD motif